MTKKERKDEVKELEYKMFILKKELRTLEERYKYVYNIEEFDEEVLGNVDNIQ